MAAVAVTLATAGVGFVTGCSGQAAARPSSVASCAQSGTNAVRHHVTLTTIPAACRGLSQVEVNVAVADALRAAAAGVHGKAGQRRLIARDSRYLAGLVRAAPEASQSPAPVTATAGASVTAAAAAPPGRAALGWAALAAWLVTAGLGMSVMVRWVNRPAQAHDGGRTPVLNYTHFGLAIADLLTWAAYLVSGASVLAWAACGLLLPVAGLGMSLVSLGPVRDAAIAPDIAGLSTAGLSADGLSTAGLSTAGLSAGGRARPRPGALVIAAHIAAASVTILLAVLAAIGSG